MNLINDIESKIKQNKTENLFKPELLLYDFFLKKNFPSFFDSIVSIPK